MKNRFLKWLEKIPIQFNYINVYHNVEVVYFIFLDREVRQYSLAAVILEEWLHELAAIAQEQSVLQKERVCQINMEIAENKDDWQSWNRKIKHRLYFGNMLHTSVVDYYAQHFGYNKLWKRSILFWKTELESLQYLMCVLQNKELR